MVPLLIIDTKHYLMIFVKTFRQETAFVIHPLEGSNCIDVYSSGLKGMQPLEGLQRLHDIASHLNRKLL